MARLDAGDAPLILDVRSPGEYAAGHIPGAVNIPHDALGVRLDELGADPDREIVVHCQSGRRAATAEQMLMDAGYTGIQHLDGDMAGWRSAGLPVEMDAAP
jgi:rhodanese-related sulfurtransferase